MKIAQVTSLIESVPPLHNNGLEFLVHFLNEGLVQKGHEVSLFATGDSETQAELIEVWPMAVSRDPHVQKAEFPWSWFGKWSHQAAYTRSSEFDVIHTHDLQGMFWATLRCPLVVTAHSPAKIFEESERRFPRHYEDYFKLTENFIREGYVIFVSDSQRGLFPAGRSHYVVHNGIPVDDFAFGSHPEDYFAFLGYITENKGPHLAIQAALKAGVKLKVAGNAFCSDAFFKQEIEPYIDGRQIKFVGPLDYDEKIEFLQQAKGVFIPIQWEEPFGLVMIEAMACGTPVIALNRASVPEIVIDGETGFICESVDEMARAAGSIDKINRQACRNHTVEKFSVEVMVRNYERVYEQIVEDFRRRFD